MGKMLKNFFIPQKTLWSCLERHMFEKVSFKKLKTLRKSTFQDSPRSSPNGKTRLQQSLERLSQNPYKSSPPKSHRKILTKILTRKPLSISRSRSRSLSKSPDRPSTNKKKAPSTKPNGLVKFGDLLLQQFGKELENDDILKEKSFKEGENSPHVSEKELRLRRQINEGRVRKIIARIDAPDYSIDNRIVYYKDLDNVADREDVFEDLMAGFFTNNASNNYYETNGEGPILEKEKDTNKVIIIAEEEEKNENKKENEEIRAPIKKIPAFEFKPRKEGIERVEWIEKREALSKRPFQSRHVINSVWMECLENQHNEKDLGNIGRHFAELRLEFCSEGNC